MPRLTAPNGSTVNVSDEKAKRLLGEGYKAVSEPKAATSKRTSSSSKSEK